MTNYQPAVLVTGANQGIGFQIAKEMASRGYTVYLGSRNLERGLEAAKAIEGDVRAIQLDVTDGSSIAAAAARVKDEIGGLDVLINNAAISNTGNTARLSLDEYVKRSVASLVSLDEVRAIWETNVFGVLAVTQAMLPLLKARPSARIVMVGSGAGSMTINSDPECPWRSIYTPGYAASKTAMNAISLAFAIELEGSSVKLNVVSPGFTKTALNGFEGTETLEEGAAEAVRVALLGPDGPHATFTHATMGAFPW